jgi:hypothetical protein
VVEKCGFVFVTKAISNPIMPLKKSGLNAVGSILLASSQTRCCLIASPNERLAGFEIRTVKGVASAMSRSFRGP